MIGTSGAMNRAGMNTVAKVMIPSCRESEDEQKKLFIVLARVRNFIQTIQIRIEMIRIRYPFA